MKDFHSPLDGVKEIHSQFSNSHLERLLVSLGGLLIEFLPCCVSSGQALTQLFHHLETNGVPSLGLAVACMRCQARLVGKFRWDWGRLTENSPEGLAWFTQGFDAVTLSDTDYQKGAFLARHMPPEGLGRREVMRLALQPFLDAHGVVGIHGATVGDSTNGVFLSNKGGSGKSTLVAQAIKMGLQTTGDDFLLVPQPGEKKDALTLASFFSNLKIHPASPGSSGLEVKLESAEPKGLVDISAHYPGALVRQHHISALVVPSFGEHTELSEATRQECLSAILPSSIQLTGSPQKLVDRVHKILDVTPAFKLVVSSEPSSGVDAILNLLRA